MKTVCENAMLCLTVLCLMGGANLVPAYGGVDVCLSTPQHRLLADEDFAVSVVLSNNSGNVIMAIDNPALALNRQLFFITGHDAKRPLDHLFANTNNESWDSIVNNRLEGSTAIADGQVKCWDYKDIFPNSLNDYGVSNICVAILVGTNDWVFSPTNSMVFSNSKVSEGALRLNSAYARLSGLESFKVYECGVDGTNFLFSESRNRICAVPTNTTTTFLMNTNSGVLTISFGANMDPVRFHVPSCGELKPWE